MAETASTGPARQAFNTAHPSSQTINSPYWHLEEVAGSQVSKVITLNVNNGTQSLNVFQVTGTVEIVKLYAELTTAGTFTNCTDAFFELYDSTASVDITNSGPGVTMSGFTAGSFMVKNAVAGTALAASNNNVGAITEGSTVKIFDEFFITQKSGANTYVRFTYTSTDTPVDATITVYADYIAIGSGTLVAA
jgi:hypothetical protein